MQRAQALLNTPAGQQSNVDAALASERAFAAQIAGAQAQLQTAQINLGYTEIRAPIDGKISATQVTEGNVVSPTSGTLANIVSQDPMYVLFPIALRAGLDLRARYANKGGYRAVLIKLRLPDGRIYSQEGNLDYVSPTVAENTDTVTLRGVIPNSLLPGMKPGQPGRARADRRRIRNRAAAGGAADRRFWRSRALPCCRTSRATIVYVVDNQNKAQVRRIQQGQSTPSIAVITNGLKEGELVISEGLTAGPTGEAVSSGPATPAPQVGTGSGAAPQRGSGEPMISAIFVDRPRLAVVIAIVITIAGLLALTRIPVAQFPDIVPPQVQVSAVYPGASAAVVEASVAQPIEAQVVGVDKMIYMKSTSANDGSYNLTVSFELGTDPDINTNAVNNRVQTALAQLPQEVQLEGLTVQKKSSAVLQFLSLYSENGQAGSALYYQLRGHQHHRRALASARDRAGAHLRCAQLFYAHLVRHQAP